MRRIVKMPLWAESRIHGDVYVRFGGRLSETYHCKVAYQKLYNYEAEEQTENKQMRESLNVYYDAFFIRFGNLNAKQNVKFILMDASGRDMLSLERVETDSSQSQTSSTTRSLFRLTRSAMSILQRKRSPPHSTSSAVSTCRI